MFISKKAIGPVIATALLILVAVVATVGFSTWFNSYQSRINTGIETQSDLNGNTQIDRIVDNTLYIKNGVGNITIKSVKISGIDCNISGNYNSSLIKLNVTDCLKNLTTNTPDIVVETKSSVISKNQYLKNIQFCSLDGISLKSGDSYNFFNSSYSHDTCYSELRTCDDGSLSGDDNYKYSSCLIISNDLTCITDNDNDGELSYICANYPMTNTTLEGNLDPDDNNANVVYNNCWLKGNKSSCLSNFVIDGCGSGTVLDKGTGLCWLRNMSYLGKSNWTDAMTDCENLNFAGHTDWHLPNKEEFKTISDLSRSNPAIVGGENNIFLDVNYTGYPYKTSSSYGVDTTNSWVIYVSDSMDGNAGKEDSGYVTCVRGD